MNDGTPSGNQWHVRLATLGTFFGLLVVLAVGLAPNLNTRVVGIGEKVWPQYARDLRTDQEPPTCDLEDIRARLAQCPAEDAAAAPPADEGGDPFAGEDPFAEPGDDSVQNGDPFAGDDPFAQAEEPADASTDDPFVGEDPFAGDDPFAQAEEPAPKINCAALRNLNERCEIRHAAYTDIQSRLTSGVKRFRLMEAAIGGVAKFPGWKHLLVLLVLLGGIATTARRAHISLRDPRNPLEHQVTQGAQLLAHLSLLASCYADRMVQQGSSAEALNTELPFMWMFGFGILSILNIHNLLKTPDDVSGPATLPRLLMVVPLYAYMVLIGTVYFQFIEGHHSGQAIFLHKFLQIPTIYLGIGLYIWAGMMLSKTTLARRCFDLLLPFGLPPTLLAWLVIMLAAIPTAYSGASGIFVIAAGAVIFEQLRSAGVSKRIALAATAMSGSLGVVLRPCLVVVLIAMLNKQVTTQQLFDNGLKVFALTAVLSLIAMLLINREGFKMAPLGQALRESLGASKRLLPFALVAAGVMLFYWIVLDTTVTEHTAPYIMPGLLLALVAYDRMVAAPKDHIQTSDSPAPEPLWPALLDATRESSSHIGALLTVMFASVGLGGVVERAELMQLLPSSFGSVYLTMAFLVVVMVLVGMTMDALGAVVLVSVSVAGVAYSNGIDPVHFWMMVLVAFELGYLTPPVALNHLLARQVIGPAAHVENDPGLSFYGRYEHLIVPMAIMGTALILVAFVPLAFY